MNRGFLDSNVLANWLLLDATIRLGKVDRAELFKRLTRQTPSYLLMEAVRTDKRFYGLLTTSRLAFAEIISVILEQAIQKRMYDQGIPFKYWERERFVEKLSRNNRSEISKDIFRLENAFFTSNQVRYVHDDYSFADFMPLVLRSFNSFRIDQYDAILISTALEHGCKFFITEDQRLRRSVSNFRGIKLVAAQDYLAAVKGSVKKPAQ